MSSQISNKPASQQEGEASELYDDSYFIYITLINRSSKSLLNAQVERSSGKYNIRPRTNMGPRSEQYFEMQGRSGTWTGCVGSVEYNVEDGDVALGSVKFTYSTPYIGDNDAGTINNSTGIKLSLYGLDGKVDWNTVEWPDEGQFPRKPIAWSLLFVVEDA